MRFQQVARLVFGCQFIARVLLGCGCYLVALVEQVVAMVLPGDCYVISCGRWLVYNPRWLPGCKKVVAVESQLVDIMFQGVVSGRSLKSSEGRFKKQCGLEHCYLPTGIMIFPKCVSTSV